MEREWSEMEREWSENGARTEREWSEMLARFERVCTGTEARSASFWSESGAGWSKLVLKVRRNRIDQSAGGSRGRHDKTAKVVYKGHACLQPDAILAPGQ
eukprot:6203168-Pleurochrysis_carterae.AAC.2